MNPIIKFTKDTTMQYILEKIPEYQSHWNEYLEYWKGDSKTIGIDIADFLDFTQNQIKAKNYKILPTIFNLIEELIIYGDEDVKYAAEMMFLESLTNDNDPETCSAYVHLLGPKSRECCIELDEYWGTRTPGLWPQEEIDRHQQIINEQKNKYADGERAECPACGHLSFYKYQFPGSEYICNNCDWIDDEKQYYNPDTDGANGVSLMQAKKNYIKYGNIHPKRY